MRLHAVGKEKELIGFNLHVADYCVLNHSTKSLPTLQLGGNSSCAGVGEGSVRLVDDVSSYEGRVDICHNGVWGTICRSSWNYQDAAVVCRQLGFTSVGNKCNTIVKYL